jgi:hypothetical protein
LLILHSLLAENKLLLLSFNCITCIAGGFQAVDPKLLIPVFDIVCPCLPATWRRRLQCNSKDGEEMLYVVASDKTEVG